MKEKYKGIPSEKQLEELVIELEPMLVERGKMERETKMKTVFDTGKILRTAESEYKVSITALVDRLAQDNRIRGRQMGERNLWFSITLFDWTKGNFEKVYDTEFGENVSLTKLKKMLVKDKPKKEKTLEELALDFVHKYGYEKAFQFSELLAKEAKRVQQEEKDALKD